MAAYQSPQDGYMDNLSQRSPRSVRNQPQLRRQASRPFDAFGGTPNPGNFYTSDEPLPRFDNGRNAFNSAMPPPPVNGGHFPYELGGSQTWNPSMQSLAGNHNMMASMNGFGNTGRMKPARGRTNLPAPWFEQSQSISQPFTGYGPPRMGNSQTRHDSQIDPDDELIPTAIVIKNIPFAVKKEQLVTIMTEMSLPLPYAFNYHFDNGVFRGLAFANFTSAEETHAVIEMLNGFELSGRKLRVEYKKMLPIQERERIEREKREKRGQLEEQHRPVPASQLQSQPSTSSLSSSFVVGSSPAPLLNSSMKPDIDMNDPRTLEFYTQIVMFKNDASREAHIFPATLLPQERRIVHTIAHKQNLQHASLETELGRQVSIYRAKPGTNVSPPHLGASQYELGGITPGYDSSRRVLSRAATTDFSDARQNESFLPNLRGQSSLGMLGPKLSASDAFGNSSILRAAKSTADLRSWTPSPVPSSSSFPHPGASARLAFENNGSSATPPLNTPTNVASGLGLRDESFLSNNFSGMSLGGGLGGSGSPRKQRGFYSSITADEQPSYTATAPIGSHRNISNAFDSTDRPQHRQPRGPVSDRSQGFRRQNGHHGRNSDELRNGPEIIVE